MKSTIIWHSAIRKIFHQAWVLDACLPMLRSVCLELKTFTRHQRQLSDDLQISEAENLIVSFSVRLYYNDNNNNNNLIYKSPYGRNF